MPRVHRVEELYPEATPVWVEQEHRHEHDELLLVQSGEHWLWEGDGWRHMGPSTLCWHPAGVTHRVRPDRSGRSSLILAWWRREAGDPEPPRVVHDPANRLLGLATWLLEAWPPENGQEEADALLLALLHQALRLGAMPAGDFVARVRGVMRRHLHRRLTLAELARAVELAPSTLSHRFRAATGRTPYQELTRLRVEAARRLRADTGLAWTAIAERVGIHHPTRLRRLVEGG